MQKYFNTVANRAGAAVSNATVTVKTQAGGFANLYSDNGVTTKANPVKTDSNGYFEFYAADGRYNLIIAGAGIGSQTINDVLLEDPAEGATSLFGAANVQLFGAKGDGTTDDTAAFNAALAVSGSIFVPYTAGGYVVGQLTLPAAFNTLTIQGGTATSNAVQRVNSTVIKTNGASFMLGAASNLLFCARDICIQSTGQTGTCFGTASAYETGFYFENVSIQNFNSAFYAPQYSSSSHARNCNFKGNVYGLWSTLEANNSSVSECNFLFNANGININGYQTIIEKIQIGAGYTGAGASGMPRFVGMYLTPKTTVRHVYVEGYGNDVSKFVQVVADMNDPSSFPLVLEDVAFPSAGDARGDLVAAQLEVKASYSSGNVPFPAEWIRMSRCIPPKVRITDPTTTRLLRGITLDGNRGITVNSYNQAWFGNVEHFVNAAAGALIPSDTGFGGYTMRALGYPTSSVQHYAQMLNTADTFAVLWDSASSAVKTIDSGDYELTVNLFSDTLTAAGTYDIAILYRDLGFIYRLAKIGTITTKGPSSGKYWLSCSIQTGFSVSGGAPVQVGFLSNFGSTAPSDADIATIAMKLRVRNTVQTN
jgi:hypothetical protein